jgi:hypothetical protein
LDRAYLKLFKYIFILLLSLSIKKIYAFILAGPPHP